MQATPSTWQLLLYGQWQPSSDVKILCGGEALSTELKDRLLTVPKTELWNMYGPSDRNMRVVCCVEIGANTGRIFG